MKQSLEELTHSQLKDLGGALGLSYPKMENMNEPTKEIVAAWLRREDYVLKRSGEPSWKILVDKLNEIGQTGVAKDINREKIANTEEPNSSANSSIGTYIHTAMHSIA